MKVVLRFYILRCYGDEFKGEIRKYEDKLKIFLNEIRCVREDKKVIGDDVVGIVDVVYIVDKIVIEFDWKFVDDK